MVTLDGLSYKFTVWEAAGCIRKPCGQYLEAPSGFLPAVICLSQRLSHACGCLGDPKSCDPAQRVGEMFIQVPYSNIETSALSFETVRLETISLETVSLERL